MAAAWHLPTQRTARADELISSRRGAAWLAPHCFLYEAPNLFLRHERRRAISPSAAVEAVDELLTTRRIRVLDPPSVAIVKVAMSIARDHAMSLFDAFYLLAAISTDATLASRDTALLGAARSLGCATYDARSLEH